MKFSYLAALALLAIALIGCGGNGDRTQGSGNSNVPEQYMQNLRAAVLTRDVDTIRNQISNSFLNDCEDKDALVSDIMHVLALPGETTFTVLPISNKDVDDIFGEFNGGFELLVTSGADFRKVRLEGRMHVKLENNTTWRLYGDQGCTP